MAKYLSTHEGRNHMFCSELMLIHENEVGLHPELFLYASGFGICHPVWMKAQNTTGFTSSQN